MEEKKRRIQITLTEREIKTLENWGNKSEVISDLIIMHLGISDDLKTEEEKRDEGEYEMYIHDNHVLLEIPYCVLISEYIEYNDGYNLDEYNEKEVIKYTTCQWMDGEFEEIGSVEPEGSFRWESKALKHFEEEIYNFAKTLKPGQRVKNGVLIDDDEEKRIFY
ncbi:hypothetical protein ACQVVX_28440 [Bacillus pacificus]|uniref:hypothetical protein n=1 Tax=Bacillus pacificus TaxID=2026187 RepID=UPI003D64DC33